MDEEFPIYQRVRGEVSVLVGQGIEAFRSRGGDGTVVIGVSLSVCLGVQMKWRFH